MKTFFFIVLFSCCTNIDFPVSDLQQLLQPKKKSESNLQEPLLNDVETPIFFKSQNDTATTKQIEPVSNKQGDFSNETFVNEEIKKIKGLKPFSEVTKEEQFVRSEISIFYAECVLERLKFLQSPLNANLQHLTKYFLQMQKNVEFIKLMLGVQLDDLKYIDKELVKEMIFDIESMENHL